MDGNQQDHGMQATLGYGELPKAFDSDQQDYGTHVTPDYCKIIGAMGNQLDRGIHATLRRL